VRRVLPLAALLLLLASPAARAQVVIVMVDGLTPADLGAFPALPAAGLANVLPVGPGTPAAGAATLGAGARARGDGDASGLGYPVHLGLLGDAARAAGTCATALGGPTAHLVTGPGASTSPECGLVVVAADRAHAPAIVRRWAGRASLLMVVSPWPGELNLAPFWISGLGRGLAFSASTRTAGVATLADLTATAAQALGAPPLRGDLGRPLRVVPGSIRQLAARFAEVRAARTRRDPLVAAGALLALAALACGWLPGLLAATAVPLAYLALGAAPLAAPGPAGLLVAAVTAALAAVAWLLERRRPGLGFGAVGLATAVTVAADLVRGGPWMAASPLGFSIAEGARFYGLGNEYAGVLLGGSLLAAGALARRPAAFLAAGLAVAALTGLPALGANYGCMLGAVAGWGAACMRAAGRRIRVGPLALAGAAAVGLALAVDRGPLASHLALNAAHLSAAGLVGLASRKLAMNLGFLRHRPYAWLPVGVLAAFAAAAFRRGGDRPALTAALQGLAVGAVVDLVLNDSGVVAAATAVLYGAAALRAGRSAAPADRIPRVANGRA
jgi:hypothetical protein